MDIFKVRVRNCCSIAVVTVAEDDEGGAPLPGAEGDGPGVVLDHDQPPHRQHQRVPATPNIFYNTAVIFAGLYQMDIVCRRWVKFTWNSRNTPQL